MEKKATTTRTRKTTAVAVPATKSSATEEERFPIVGIGASAGGLPALEKFLRRVPKGCGMAFVVIQHLDPTRKGIMAELLQRSTEMKVIEVQDGMKVDSGVVYVIPPNKDLSILHGVLHLLAPATPRGLRLPIDFFLTSLAQDRREHSIGVILSGMGADGTAGLGAIREAGGLVVVQDPETAEFDSMPQSAVDAGLPDIVAPVDQLPEKITAWLRHTLLPALPAPGSREKEQNMMDKIVVLLRAQTGNDFSHYKGNTLCRRVERRMGVHQILKMADYVRYLRENPQEVRLLFKELLIGVTSFFRDPAAWEQLRRDILPALMEGRPPQETLRAWVPGCSTGEEAYTLAIVLQETAEAVRPRRKFHIQVFATDLDQDAIDKARTGLFPAAISADVSAERLKRFFGEVDSGYRVRKEIREMVVFAPQNLLMDPPFTKLDILCCRNLLIYLTPEVQKKLIPLFHYSLRPDGILFQGSAETIGEGTELFAPLGGKSRLFRRIESDGRPEPISFPSSSPLAHLQLSDYHPPNPVPASLQIVADQLVLQRYAPPSVLTNDQGDILYVSGRTGKYLEPAAGKANWNVFAMAREGLRYELASAFPRALRQKEPVALQGWTVGTNGGTQIVDISVQQLDEPGPLKGLVMIVFKDGLVGTDPPGRGHPPAKRTVGGTRVAELSDELRKAQAEARTRHEEMQTSQEELRSANEELQSTNEEMQSTNEELTTSKEEMQSMNEELQAVNVELQSMLDELSRTSNDMKNLLDSTDIATLFLDRDLNVRRFTPQATKIIKLIPGDAGRPITDLVSDLKVPALADDAREVLRTLVPAEKAVETHDGRWFSVRIMLYRTLDDRIDGVVITFANITVAKTLEGKLLENQSVLENNVAAQATELKFRRNKAKP